MTWAATTLGRASWRMSLGRSSPRNRPTNILRIDSIPPNPVPCVEATSEGWTALRSSAGVKPADRKASTAVTRFQEAMGSMPWVIEAGMPQRSGSKSRGNWPPTVRDSAARRGTRASEPASRVTVHSPVSASGTTSVCSGSEASMVRAVASSGTDRVMSRSR